MRSTASPAPARRASRLALRRARRRPVLVAAGLALGIAVTTGFTATSPAALADASGNGSGYVLASFTAAPAVVITPADKADESSAARKALAAAEASLAAAQSVAADIAASGLDIGVTDTSIDTDALAMKAAGLDAIDSSETPLVASIADDVLELVASTDERVASLRGSLDAALAVKAEQEAAEKARLEAEAAAAAAAAAAEEAAAQVRASVPSAPVYATGGAVGDNSPAGAQATARAMLGNYGWGDDQFSCLVSLWNKESGWNYQAYNSSSGAFGIPQALPGSKMASAGADWQTSAATQVSWGLGYISGRYGSPCSAWSHSQSVGWY